MKTFYQRMMGQFESLKNLPGQFFKTVDLHTGGEPLRIIVSGFPDPEGRSVLAYREHLRAVHDGLRKLLMWEPRGHADMYGCILTPPNNDGADFGVVFMHNEGYSTMCGHAVIAITKLAALVNWKETDEQGIISLQIDAPCGRIQSQVDTETNDAYPVSFIGVPSFASGLDIDITLSDGRKTTLDIAYGGAFYAYVDADRLGLSLHRDHLSTLVTLGREIKHLVAERHHTLIKHPYESSMDFLYGTIFTSEQQNSAAADSRNICIFADGEVDRSPTGSGASGRMALLQAKAMLSPNQPFVIESITGSRFKASYLDVHPLGTKLAVVPKVAGNAFLTGQHTFYLGQEDEFPSGFFLR